MHLKICYFHDGDAPAAALRLSEIRRLIQATFGTTVPVTTAFGVNLLYEGLLLDIDASAGIGSRRREDTAHASRRGRFIQADARAGAAQQAWSGESLRASCRQCLDDVAALAARWAMSAA